MVIFGLLIAQNKLLNMVSRFITTYSKGKYMLLCLALIILINLIFANAFISNVKPLDLAMSYNGEEAYQLLLLFNEEDLKTYQLIEFTLDMVYPFIYSCFLCFSIFILLKNLSLAKVPIAMAIFDVMENALILILIQNLPEKMLTTGTAAGVFTTLKWTMFTIVVLIIFYGLIKRSMIHLNITRKE